MMCVSVLPENYIISSLIVGGSAEPGNNYVNTEYTHMIFAFDDFKFLKYSMLEQPKLHMVPIYTGFVYIQTQYLR